MKKYLVWAKKYDDEDLGSYPVAICSSIRRAVEISNQADKDRGGKYTIKVYQLKEDIHYTGDMKEIYSSK